MSIRPCARPRQILLFHLWLALGSEVLNLRIKGKLAGDGGGYDFADLHYLSAHTLESKSGIAYAKTRVYRELLDAWLSKRIVFQGKKFDDTDIALTDKDWLGRVVMDERGSCCFVRNDQKLNTWYRHIHIQLHRTPPYFIKVHQSKLVNATQIKAKDISQLSSRKYYVKIQCADDSTPTGSKSTS